MRLPLTRRRAALTSVALTSLAISLATAGPAAATVGPGVLDPSFGAGGIVKLAGGTQLFGVATQSNGESVAVGEAGGSVLVERFTATGAVDGLYSGPAGAARAVAIQPDGRIVVAGTSGGAMFVERFTTSLSPDSSFGSGGVATALGGQNAVANSVAIAPDGSVIAAGSVYAANTRAGVASFTAAGAVKWAEVPGFDNNSLITGIAVQPSGKIVFVGHQTPSQVTDAVIGRLNSDGSFDSTFSGGGAFTYHYPGGGYTGFNAVTLQTDGRIVVAGADAGGPNALFVRLSANGAFDPTFGSGGVAAVSSGVQTPGDPVGAYSVAIAGGGRIVGGGFYEFTSSEVDAAVWALSPSGSPDPAFGTGGTVRGPKNGYEGCGLAVAPDGSLMVDGDTVTASGGDPQPCSLNSDPYATPTGFIERFGGFGPAPSGPATSAPTVTTGGASGIGSSTATLSGQVNPGGLSTTYHFEYGTSSSYGSSTTPGTLNAGTSSRDLHAALTGLTPGTTYHYRLVASNDDGTSDGADATFTTSKGTTPPPPPPALKATLKGVGKSYKRAAFLASGIRLMVGCNQPCSAIATLTLASATARKLHLSVKLVSGRATLKASGSGSIKLKLTSGEAKALAKQKTFKLTLTVVVKATATGKQQRITRTLTIGG